jgi:hypothetical protein
VRVVRRPTSERSSSPRCTRRSPLLSLR